MSKPVIILGAGGHAKVIIDILLVQQCQIIGITEAGYQRHSQVLGIDIIGGDEAVAKYQPQDVLLVNAVGMLPYSDRRLQLYKKFKQQSYHFKSAIHSASVIANETQLAEGIQVMAGAIINPGVVIAENCIVNTGAIIDHDCNIGSGVHIAPGATIGGGVVVGDNTFIGMGAVILNGIKVASNSVVGAGAVVTADVPENVTVAGVPAKRIK
ncbi:MAG: acetyltransferase [Gammaproteobacteria bacterium]|nr:acetyltransferase [Gammaproteobacteria bacterium]